MVDYKRVPFDRALQFLSDRVVLPSETWQEQMGDAQNWAFTIAGITKASLLQEIQARTTQAIADGDSFEDFRADFERIMVKSGMSPLAPWRMRLIMLQNMRHSYNAGRYREQTDPETMRRRPWAIYRHDHPITPRPHHLALHGFTARISDPIWQRIYPVNGFNCRCAVRTIDQEEFDRDGHSASPPLVKDAAGMPVVNIDGKDVRVAEKGFEFAPGANDTAYRGRVLTDALRKMSPDLRREFMRVMGDRLPRPGQPVEPVNLPEPAPEPQTKPKAKPGRAKTRTVRPEYKPEDTLWDERRNVAHNEFRRREAVWDNAPPWVRNVISRIAPPGFIDPATVEDSNKKGAYHNLNGIHLNGWTPDKIQSGALWRHEYGHYIDRILGRRLAHRLNEIFQENPVDFISNRDSRFVKALATDNEKLITMKARTLELQASNVQKYLEKHRNKQGFIDTATLETLEFAPTKASPAELVSTLDSAQLRRAHETIWFLERRNRDIDALVRRSPKVWQYFYEQFDVAKNAGNERIGVRSDFLAAMATQDIEFLVKWVYSLDKKWVYDAMDLVGSITRNAVSQGHSDDYYRIPGMSGTETIANIVDMVSQADIGEDFVRYLAPNTLRATRKIFEEFVKSGDFEFTGYINKDNPPKVFSDD